MTTRLLKIAKEIPDIQHIRHPRYDSTEDSRLMQGILAHHKFLCNLSRFLTRSLVAVQIASDLFEYQEKARSIQVYMSTFDAGIGQIRGELNSYGPFKF